jgi:hypothetical protein
MNTTHSSSPVADHTTDQMTDVDTETDLVSGCWEPCLVFAAEVADSQVCVCGWLHDDHGADAIVHQLPRAPRAAQPRRLAS